MYKRQVTRDTWLRPDPGGRDEKGRDKLTSISTVVQSHEKREDPDVPYL